MWSLYQQSLSYLNGLTPRQWFYGLMGVVIVGLVCMRGFGSRKNW